MTSTVLLARTDAGCQAPQTTTDERDSTSPEVEAKQRFADIFASHHDRLYGICARMLGPGDDAEDAVQETFLALLRQIDELRGPVKPWLNQVAYNQAAKIYRQRRRVQMLESDLASDQTDKTDIARVLDETLDRLEPAERELVLRHCRDRETLTALAAEQSLSIPGLRKRLHKILGRVRRSLRRSGVGIAMLGLMSWLRNLHASEKPKGFGATGSGYLAGALSLGSAILLMALLVGMPEAPIATTMLNAPTNGHSESKKPFHKVALLPGRGMRPEVKQALVRHQGRWYVAGGAMSSFTSGPTCLIASSADGQNWHSEWQLHPQPLNHSDPRRTPQVRALASGDSGLWAVGDQGLLAYRQETGWDAWFSVDGNDSKARNFIAAQTFGDGLLMLCERSIHGRRRLYRLTASDERMPQHLPTGDWQLRDLLPADDRGPRLLARPDSESPWGLYRLDLQLGEWTCLASLPIDGQLQEIDDGLIATNYRTKTVFMQSAGNSWRQLSLPPLLHAEDQLLLGTAWRDDQTGIILVGSSRPGSWLRTFRTTDGGAHWSLGSVDLDQAPIQTIATAGRRHAIMLGTYDRDHHSQVRLPLLADEQGWSAYGRIGVRQVGLRGPWAGF